MDKHQPGPVTGRQRHHAPPTRRRKMGMAPFMVTMGSLCALILALLGRYMFASSPDLDDFSYLKPLLAQNDSIQDPEAWLQSWGRRDPDEYLLGVGKADITGPIVEINMMGYADFKQSGSGLRQRLYSRAFIVGSFLRPEDRFIYLVLDVQSGDTAVRNGILSGLKAMGPAYSMYGQNNLAVTGTHSHSGPGAWLNYFLPQITSLGIDAQSYRAIVDGCLLSIQRAHESLEPGLLSAGATKIADAGINRSLFSYFANPPEERARYNVSSEDDGSVEQDLTMLKFQRSSDGKNIGVLTWFPTHGTSMLPNNTLITGDNKGVAADLLEKAARQRKDAADDFVAGFSQANMGDVSPNVLGAWCEDKVGAECSFENSSCENGKTDTCHARGPGFREDDNGSASCFEIGRRQSAGALELYESLNRVSRHRNSPMQIRGGGVAAVHTFQEMSNLEFNSSGVNGTMTTLRTCPAALGYSFFAGTTDGPGQFGLPQHDARASNAKLVVRAFSRLVKKTEPGQVDCHYPKPILLDLGGKQWPYSWAPTVIDIQTFRVGQFFIIVSSGETTTMAGRRWKEALAREATAQFGKEMGEGGPVVVLGGPGNSYSHYITTPEEYGVQRYEGAATLFGPNTLPAYIDLTVKQVELLGADQAAARRASHSGGRSPPDNRASAPKLNLGVFFDRPGIGRHFGNVVRDVEQENYKPRDRVVATFVAANPRNNLRLERTYAAVEYRAANGGSDDNAWGTVRDDSDWGLIFRWKRTSTILGTSEAELTWEIEEKGVAEGEYRLRYYGDSKSFGGEIIAFEGVSRTFRVSSGGGL